MKTKKSIQADLERRKGLFFQIGLVTALAVILISFEWTSSPRAMEQIYSTNEIEIVEEMLLIPIERPKKEEQQEELPQIAEVIELVDDDIVLEEFKFANEWDGKTGIDITNIDLPTEVVKDQPKFYKVEDMPLFNGGEPETEFRKYIAKNLVYPEIAANNGVSGKVIIEFAVDPQGKVVDAVVLREVDPALDAEALRVILGSPLWTPGKQRGKAVKVHFVFPITFRLQ
jgi:protein TonB